MQLPQKQKIFSQRLSGISKSTSNLEYFPKNDNPHSWFISNISNGKERG